MFSWKRINKRGLLRLFYLILFVIFVILIIQVDWILKMFSDSFIWFVGVPKLFHCFMAVSIVISICHFLWVPNAGIVKEHLLYKRLTPILSIPLTTATHAIFIYCGIQLIYLFCYDEGTMKKYSNIDKTAMTVTMIAIMTYAVYSIVLILFDIANPKRVEESHILTSSSNEETTE